MATSNVNKSSLTLKPFCALSNVRKPNLTPETGGATLQQISNELNNMAVPTPRGKQWTPTAARNAINRA